MRNVPLTLRGCLVIAEGVPFRRRRGGAGVVAGVSGSGLGVHVQKLNMDAKMSVQFLDVGYPDIIPHRGNFKIRPGVTAN